MSDINETQVRLVASRTLRMVARNFFDHLDLSPRDEEWVDRDSFDLGLIAAAKYLLAQVDVLESGHDGQG